MPYSLSIRPYGIHAVLIEWPNEVDEDILNDILQFKDYLISDCLDNDLWELVPAYNSMTLVRRNESVDFKKFSGLLRKWYAAKGDKALYSRRYLCRLPVCYDLDFGIDLQEVSEKLQMEIPEIIKQHTENIYRVFGIGFFAWVYVLGWSPKIIGNSKATRTALKSSERSSRHSK